MRRWCIWQLSRRGNHICDELLENQLWSNLLIGLDRAVFSLAPGEQVGGQTNDKIWYHVGMLLFIGAITWKLEARPGPIAPAMTNSKKSREKATQPLSQAAQPQHQLNDQLPHQVPRYSLPHAEYSRKILLSFSRESVTNVIAIVRN